MPELPEVEVTRRGFADSIAGARIEAARLGKPLRWALGIEPGALVGRSVRAVRRRGKYLLMHLDQGILLMHLVLACASTVMIWLVWWAHFRARRTQQALFNYYVAVELLAVALVALTAHLGGFLSGVNAPG